MAKTYGQYCPIAKAAEIVADRWTPLIVREMLHGVHRFNELERGLPGIPRSLLAQRLRHLERAGVVSRRAIAGGRGTEYYLTPAGEQLHDVLEVLGNWGALWAFADPEPDELDPLLLLWWMRRRINAQLLPPRRIVVQFDFHGERAGTYWLLLEPAEVSVCVQHPGFDIDLLVSAQISALYRVWFGRIAFADAQRAGLIELEGAATWRRDFAGWFALSPFAPAVRAAGARIATESLP
jgi:DNA-binding HxlR family transcriptional regulator